MHAASVRNACEMPHRSMTNRLRFGAINPATPTPAFITPIAKPRLVRNHGAIRIEVGTSDTDAQPIPSNTQNA